MPETARAKARDAVFRFTGAADDGTRFLDSRTAVAFADLRGRPELEAAASFARSVAASGGALIVAADDSDTIDAMIAAGATHELPENFDAAAFTRAVRMAERYVARPGRGFDARKQQPVQTRAVDDVRERLGASLAEPGKGLLLLVALNRFEMINTAFGHEVGDALLEAVAGRIGTLQSEQAPDAIVVGRLAGAEFVILLNDPRPAAAERTAIAIVERLERPYLIGGHLVSVGACVGLAERAPDDDVSILLQRASVALASARSARASVHTLSVADEGTALFDASLEADLRRALAADEIEILFQPQVSVTTGAVVGAEALARWQHPDHGELGAETLFAVADRSNYLAALSQHVQRKAAAIAAKWPKALAHLRLSINVTAADIARPTFVDTFLAMADASGFPRGRLTVEITESQLIDDLERAAELLAGLRAGGCRVAIDDFGTGYSSLAYLKALPLDALKIDKALAQDIAGTARDRVVVRGVIEMARSLGLSVIAEGVETEEQLGLLAGEGVNLYQGFLFAEAVGVEELARLTETQARP